LPADETRPDIDETPDFIGQFKYLMNGLATADMQSLRDQCRLAAADGHLELFKMTTKYDGKVGREQHHFPTAEQLPL
jgi:hypothetical protein